MIHNLIHFVLALAVLGVCGSIYYIHKCLDNLMSMIIATRDIAVNEMIIRSIQNGTGIPGVAKDTEVGK